MCACVYVSVFVRVCALECWFPEERQRELDPLDLEVQAVVSHSMYMLVPELRSPAKEVCSLKHCASRFNILAITKNAVINLEVINITLPLPMSWFGTSIELFP